MVEELKRRSGLLLHFGHPSTIAPRPPCAIGGGSSTKRENHVAAIRFSMPQAKQIFAWTTESYRCLCRLSLAVLEFLVPCHLNGFELGFVGGLRIARKAGELDDPFVHVGEADGERIDVGMFVGESDGDVVQIVPVECCGHFHSLDKKKDCSKVRLSLFI